MKRLRLIKPWRLNAVRQRLIEDGRLRYNDEEPATCPVSAAPAPENFKRYNTFINNCVRFTKDARLGNGNQAPFSDVIFVSSNRNIR